MRNPKQTKRLGLATLEFVLVLPVLLWLFLLIWGFGKTHIARSNAIVKAKNSAWKARYGDLGGEASSSDATKLMSAARQPGEVNPGVSRKTHAEPLKIAWFLQPASGTAKDSHAVLGGAYDHRNISFKSGTPLVPSPRLAYFSADLVGSLFSQAGSLGSLNALGNPSGTSPANLDQLLNSVTQRINELRRTVDEMMKAPRDFYEYFDDNPLALLNPPLVAFKVGELAANLVADAVNVASSDLPSLIRDLSSLSDAAGIPLDDSLLSKVAAPGVGDIIGTIERYARNPSRLLDDLRQVGNFGNEWNNLLGYLGKTY